MRKTLLFILLLTGLSFGGWSQNYQCFSAPGVVQWYIDSVYYLRAIRIDSIRSAGTDTIYYPFHTNRGYFDTATGLVQNDTTGSSWVGKRVVQKPDGTFLFGNTYHDTVFIKTQAHIGDSWIFYNDSGRKFYKATVTEMDTMTILGSLDSLKRIRINTYNPTYDTFDFANNFTLAISKNHGFVQIFDLYNFPYHRPLSSANDNDDDYFSFVDHLGGSGAYTPASKHIFNATPFRMPTRLEVYDLQAEDVVEHKTASWCWPCDCGDLEDNLFSYDSVVSRTDIDSSNRLIVFYKKIYDFSCYSNWGSITYQLNQYRNKLDTLHVNDVPVFTMIDLPEEHGNYFSNAYYYNPTDTSFCTTSPWIASTSYNFNAVEPCSNYRSYKVGLGMMDSSYCKYCMRHDTGPDISSSVTVDYVVKNGIACGHKYPMLAPAPPITATESNATIVPNPASDEVTVESSIAAPCTVRIINSLGIVITSVQGNSKVSLNVRNYPSGIYYLALTFDNGTIKNEKLIISH